MQRYHIDCLRLTSEKDNSHACFIVGCILVVDDGDRIMFRRPVTANCAEEKGFITRSPR
jgi:hypothetical protein